MLILTTNNFKYDFFFYFQKIKYVTNLPSENIRKFDVLLKIMNNSINDFSLEFFLK